LRQFRHRVSGAKISKLSTARKSRKRYYDWEVLERNLMRKGSVVYMLVLTALWSAHLLAQTNGQSLLYSSPILTLEEPNISSQDVLSVLPGTGQSESRASSGIRSADMV